MTILIKNIYKLNKKLLVSILDLILNKGVSPFSDISPTEVPNHEPDHRIPSIKQKYMN